MGRAPWFRGFELSRVVRARPRMQQGSVRSVVVVVVVFFLVFVSLCACLFSFSFPSYFCCFFCFFVEVSCFFLGGFEQSSTRLY